MNHLSYIILIASLSGLNLCILLLVHILEYAHTAPKQKILFIKSGLALIGLAPLLFYFLHFPVIHVLDIPLTAKFVNPLPIKTLSTATFIDWPFFLFAGYCAGVLIMLTRIAISYIHARKMLAGSIPAFLQGQLVFLSKNIQNPLCFGFLRAKIYFPQEAKRTWSGREIQMALAHEQTHQKQFDSLWKLYSLIIQACLFFAPWSYSLHRRLALEMEVFCDQQACTNTGASTHEYGNFLLAIASLQSQFPIFNNITDITLKRRLLAMKSKFIQRKLLLATCGVLLFLAGAATVAATGGVTASKSAFDIVSKIFVDGTLVSSPRIITKANADAAIFLSSNDHVNELEIVLNASDAEKNNIGDGIKIKYDIKYKDAAGKIHSRQEIVITPNQEETISLATNSGHLYEMRVIAKRE